MTSKIKVDTIENVAGSGNVSLGSGHNLVVPGNLTTSGAFTSQGIDDNANNTAIAIDTNEDFTITKQGTNTTDIRLANSADSFGGNIKYDHNVGNMIFHVHNGERIRFRSDGGICFNGDTAAQNALDDYEEGSWTPICATAGVSGSYSVQLGRYIKIGSLVQCIFNLTTSSSYTGSTSSVFQIGGLPFSNRYYDASLYAGGNIGYYFNINTVDSAKQIVYQIPSSSDNKFELKGTGDNQGEISIVVSNMNSNSVIRGQLVYHTA